MGHTPVVRSLIGWGEDVNFRGTKGSPLQAAAMKGQKAVFHLLLDEGAHVNQKSQSWGRALQAAARGEHTESVQLLLARGADIRLDGKYTDALHAAIEGGHESFPRRLSPCHSSR
ncbi:ankyrin repeat protein [Colletotrichum truncatum]|uniref:Ankyrin repeat protein n=1 Tax=Colletotrichum truncatum TaxID=5467 RepID=A0ACC3YDS0_COLTU|nr:ankyrin repeat protein [Colletotrichum truncatum]KAF6783028.1 ankyrin repeat protein [Colletotrichum truncatum]